MTLDKFLDQPGWSEGKLAAAARRFLPPASKLGQSAINRLRHRERTAGLALALAIERASGGKVRAEAIPLSREDRRLLREIRLGEFCHQSPVGAAA